MPVGEEQVASGGLTPSRDFFQVSAIATLRRMFALACGRGYFSMASVMIFVVPHQ